MKKNPQYLSLLTPVLLFWAVVFAGLMAVVGISSYREEQKNLEEYTSSRMKEIILGIEAKVLPAESVLKYESHEFNRSNFKKKDVFERLESILNDNSFISNACLDLWEEDEDEKMDTSSYTYYVGRDKQGNIQRLDLLVLDSDLSKNEIDAFKKVTRSGGSAWSQPYYDSLFTQSYVMTCFRKSDIPGMMLSVDLELSTLLQHVESMQFYQDSKMYIMDAQENVYTIYEGEIYKLEDTEYDRKTFVTISAHYENLDLDLINFVPRSQVYKSTWENTAWLLAFAFLGLILLSVLVHHHFMKAQTELAASIKETNEKETELRKIENDLEIAARIQNRMLSSPGKGRHLVSPGGHAADIMSQIIPAREVGGDFYEYRLTGDKLVVCIGDVSGKGIPSSVVMTMCCTLFHAYVSDNADPDPSGLLKYMNAQLGRNNHEMIFVTMWAGVLDTASGKLRFSSAGHNRAVLVRQEASYLEICQGLPLGLFEDAAFKNAEISLGEGDALLLYTDGITEAEGPGNELFGDDRLLQACNASPSHCPQLVCDTVLSSVRVHARGCVQSDDITLLCITPSAHFAQLQGIADVKALHTLAQECGDSYRTSLALEELAVNAFDYGGAGFVSVEWKDGRYVMTDNGAGFDPTAYEAEPGSDGDIRIGGKGISLVRKICSEFNYRRIEDRYNEITLKTIENPNI